MKRFTYILSIFALLVSLGSSTVNADDSGWELLLSYQNPTKAVKAGSKVYVLANNDLYSYDSDDSSVETYDKATVLSDFGIYDIAYCQSLKTLVILYDNANIDLLDSKGECWNMPELKNKSLSDKTINSLKVYGQKIYVTTNAGIVMADVKRRIFDGLYNFGQTVTTVMANDSCIYANTASAVYQGNFAQNLLDASNWKAVTTFPKSNFTAEQTSEKAVSDSLINVVSKNAPNSPVRNYSWHLNMVDGRLLVAGGHFSYDITGNYPGTAMKYEDGKWSSFDEVEPYAIAPRTATYTNITDIVQDPDDPEHHFVGTARSGIYEFKDYKLVHHYTSAKYEKDTYYVECPITSILPESKNTYDYVRTTALNIDANGNLWFCNNECDTVVRIMKKNGKFVSLHFPEISTYPTFDRTIFDKRGWAWLSSRRFIAISGKSRYATPVIIDTNGTIDNPDDDRCKIFRKFENQDQTEYEINEFNCVCEDLNGAIWLGADKGLFVTKEPENVFNDSFHFEQVKVPRNDGSGLADYLLSNEHVTCISIDGANRKWIGTKSDGIYLISADGLEQLEHFTTENTPLISNSINDVAVDGETGWVYIATASGLCRYHGDAIDPAETLDNSALKVYPNPVRPEYSGDVHISGLMINTDVKIVNAAGKLVYEGLSTGGQFNWNCCYKTGKRVHSGIYYALCTDENGKKDACTKILIIK